jgi:hypothetical protein
MEYLDENELIKLKDHMISALLSKKIFRKYRFEDYYTIAVDATGVHTYEKRHCDQCLVKTYKSGDKKYFHNVLEAKLVTKNGFCLSVATQWIENENKEYKKQDCESKAFVKIATILKKKFPRLKICIAGDGLYPNNTFFDICKDNKWRYILTFKTGNLATVWKYINGLESSKINNINNEFDKNSLHIKQEISWINEIRYKNHKMNYIRCIETKTNLAEIKKSVNQFIHITNFDINNKNAINVSETGRLRWKIENEGFNCQKNHGYNLKHKYSRTNYIATKNYYQCLQIAHIINQLVTLNIKFIKRKNSKMTIKHLWKQLLSFITQGMVEVNTFYLIRKKRTVILFV